MFEGDLLADAARFRALGQQLAAAITTDISGLLAAEALEEVLAAVRFGELATCRLIERVDRSGEWTAHGSASTVAQNCVLAAAS